MLENIIKTNLMSDSEEQKRNISADELTISEEDFKKRFDFDTSKVLGEGGFAKVYKAYDKRLDEYVALKFQYVDKISKYDIIREVKTSRKLSHKNITRVHDVNILRTNRSFGQNYIQVGVLEYAELGNLYDYLKTSPSEKDFKEIFSGVLDGLEFLHREKNLIHRDLSLDNILIFKEDGKIVPKLADFGISKALTSDHTTQKKSTQLVGKVEYMAPEQFSADKFGIGGKISTNVDLWSFGVIIYELFMKRTPFAKGSDDNPMSIMHNICNEPLPKDVEEIPEPYCTIIKKCLVKNATYRIQRASELKVMFESFSDLKHRFGVRHIILAILALLVVAGGIYFGIVLINSPVETRSEDPPKIIQANSLPSLKTAFSEFTDLNKPYDGRRAMIDLMVDDYFADENVPVEVLVDNISTDRKGIRQFLMYALSKDVKKITIESSDENQNKKIVSLTVSIQE
jgi:serine/threonine protein kinase